MAQQTAALPASRSSSSDEEEDEDVQMHPPLKKSVEETTEVEEDDDDDSNASANDDSDPDDAVPAPPTKPLVSSSKPIPSSSSNKSTANAPAAAGEKKKRKAVGTPPPSPETAAAGGQKRQRFQRIWSGEDEIALLKGMLTYKLLQNDGRLPKKNDLQTFYHHIKKDLTLDVNKAQLSEKIRRIKDKYKAAVDDGGKARATSPHDAELFKLAHKIWAAEDGNDAVGAKAGGESRKKVNAEKNKSVAAAEDGNDAVGAKAGGESRKKVNVEKKKSVAAAEDGNVAVGAKAGGESRKKVNAEKNKSVAAADECGGSAKPRYTYFKHAVTQMADCLPNNVDIDEALEFVDDSKATILEKKMKELWIRKQKNQIIEINLNKEVKRLMLEALDKMT